jgi:hypothetical protein
VVPRITPSRLGDQAIFELQFSFIVRLNITILSKFVIRRHPTLHGGRHHPTLHGDNTATLFFLLTFSSINFAKWI